MIQVQVHIKMSGQAISEFLANTPSDPAFCLGHEKLCSVYSLKQWESPDVRLCSAALCSLLKYIVLKIWFDMIK